jgi:hypothetical protein
MRKDSKTRKTTERMGTKISAAVRRLRRIQSTASNGRKDKAESDVKEAKRLDSSIELDNE